MTRGGAVVARQAHNLKAVRSNRAPATNLRSHFTQASIGKPSSPKLFIFRRCTSKKDDWQAVQLIFNFQYSINSLEDLL